MKLSLDLTQAGYVPDTLETEAAITLDNGTITKSELTLKAKVPGISNEKFQEIAKGAEQTCPVSGAFSFEITLLAVLIDD